MKTTMSFLVLLLLPFLLHAKIKRTTLKIPLVHNGAQVFDSKNLFPPLSSPPSHRGFVFLANIYFGTPPIKQYLVLDTGSDLTWTQCFPCSRCFDQEYLKYQPKKSTTYRDASRTMCESETDPRFGYSPWTGKCNYDVSYADGTVIKGTFGQEMITVATLEGEYKRLYGMYFGCAKDSKGEDFIGTGILGLSPGEHSLVWEFGSKFSFCLGRISQPEASHNLILGEEANTEGHPTTINVTTHQYLFSLEYIIVGKKITLDDPVQVVVDTGTVLSFLPTDVYYKFVDELEELLGQPATYRPDLCYKEDVVDRLEKIDVGFVFAGGAELRVNVPDIFLPSGSPGFRCLAITYNKDSESEIIIGVTAMQGHNLGYDIEAKMAYIQKQTCNM